MVDCCPDPEPTTDLDVAIANCQDESVAAWLRELRDARKTLDVTRNLLRLESEAGRDTDRPYNCTHCGYVGPFCLMGCACYEDWAVYCRPDAPGPGCPHGSKYCPVCGGEDQDPVDEQQIAMALMMVERQLGIVYTEQELEAAPLVPPDPDSAKKD